MKIIRIETVQEAMSLLVDQPYDEERKIYRNLYVYRGLPNVDYRLLTSLRRNCGKKQKELEQHILDNFSKYAEHEAPSMLTSVWKRMILGQHHGLPTRLLDWSRSPLVALHFAMTESDYTQMDKHDAAVWKIDIPDLKEHLHTVADHVVDLLVPFQSGWYYKKEIGGSFSIKSVLPAICPDDPELDYHELEGVHNGTEAMSIYPEIQYMPPEEQEKARRNLLAYCKLDTLAMVKVWEELKRAAED